MCDANGWPWFLAAAYTKAWANKSRELSALWQGAEVDEIDKTRPEFKVGRCALGCNSVDPWLEGRQNFFFNFFTS